MVGEISKDSSGGISVDFFGKFRKNGRVFEGQLTKAIMYKNATNSVDIFYSLLRVLKHFFYLKSWLLNELLGVTSMRPLNANIFL